MAGIVAGILSVLQHLEALKEEAECYRPARCCSCGKSGLWRHGHYERKADRQNQSAVSLNPILIQRFFCPYCQKTCSVLPECIPPRRWYLWEVQQRVICMLLSGASLHTASQATQASRSTCRRWWSRLKEQFLIQSDALRTHFCELGRNVDFNSFWRTCLNQMSFGMAMLLCKHSGVIVP